MNLFLVIRKTLVPQFLQTGGPYTTLGDDSLFFFVTTIIPYSNFTHCSSTSDTDVIHIDPTVPCTRRFYHIYKPLAFILPSKPEPDRIWETN